MDHGNDLPITTAQPINKSKREVDLMLYTMEKRIGDNVDWELRVQSLQNLQGLALGGESQSPSFHQFLGKMKEEIGAAACDLRSAVVREACVTIAVLAETMNDNFEPFATQLIRHILKSTVNSKAIIASSADTCIIRILKSTKKGWAGPLQLIAQELLTSKNAFLQMKCSSYLFVMLTRWDKHVFERHLDLLVRVLLSAVVSKDEKSRAISRASYWTFNEHFPTSGKEIMDHFDPSTQRKLTESKNVKIILESHQSEEREINHREAVQKRVNILPSASASSLPPLPVPTKSFLFEEESPLVKLGASNLDSKVEKQLSASRCLEAELKDEEDMSNKKKSRSASHASRVVKDESKDYQNIEKNKDQVEGRENRRLGSAMRVARPPVVAEPQKAEVVCKVKNEKVKESAPLRTLNNNAAVVNASEEKVKVEERMCIGVAMEGGNDADWKKRLTSAQEISRLLQINESVIDVKIDKFVKFYSDRLNDSHHRISLIYLESLGAFINKVSAILVSSHIETLTEIVIHKLLDSKKVIVEGANKAIVNFIKTLGEVNMFDVFRSLLDGDTSNIRYVNEIIKLLHKNLIPCKEHLSNLRNIKLLLHQGTTLILRKRSQLLQRSVSTLMEDLYKMNQVSFVKVLKEMNLTSQDFESVFENLNIPDLKIQVKEMQKKPNAHEESVCLTNIENVASGKEMVVDELMVEPRDEPSPSLEKELVMETNEEITENFVNNNMLEKFLAVLPTNASITNKKASTWDKYQSVICRIFKDNEAFGLEFSSNVTIPYIFGNLDISSYNNESACKLFSKACNTSIVCEMLLMKFIDNGDALEGGSLKCFLSLLPAILQKANLNHLSKQMPTLMSIFRSLLSHSFLVVRKLTTESIATLYNLENEMVEPHLSLFSSYQRTLIFNYVKFKNSSNNNNNSL